MKSPLVKVLSLLLVTTIALLSCHKGKENNWTLQIAKVKSSHWMIQEMLLQDLQKRGIDLQKAASDFVNTPSSPYMDLAKNAWNDCINSYENLSVSRYMEPGLSAGFSTYNKYINLYPLDGAYVDYTQSSSFGIIQNTAAYPAINLSAMESWHQAGGSANLSLGFHVTEFLLWGEDLSTAGPGSRSPQDYIGSSGAVGRRKAFLTYSTTHLNDQFKKLSFAGSYKTQLDAMDPKEYIRNLNTAITRLIDEEILAGILQPALASQAAPNEISDFSDLTCEQIKAKIRALQYAFDPSDFLAANSGGYFLGDLMEEMEPGSSESINQALKNAFAAMGKLTYTFEEAIANPEDRAFLFETVSQLQQVSEKIKAFSASF